MSDQSLGKSLRRLLALFLWAALFLSRGASAGEVQEIIDLTGFRPSPVPGEFIAPSVPIHWDSRCIPIPIQMNITQDPVPNPNGPPVLTVAEAAATLQAAGDLWDSIPTSYARIKVEGTTANAGGWGFDLVNEVTFRTAPGFPRNNATTFSVDYGPIMAVRFTRVLADLEFTDGLDLNRDGISDVSSSLTTCKLINGHLVYPPGLYKAGTIIDADIIFNAGVSTTGPRPDGFTFTNDLSMLGQNPRAVDFFGASVHAIGMLFGVAHSRTNQRSASDGRGATMFAYIDTDDPDDQVAWRTIDTDAVTSVSTLYPEGSAATGPGALGPGDRPFAQEFGFVTGNVTLGSRNELLLGASVFAVDVKTGAIVGTAVSGHSQFSSSADGFRATFLGPDFHALDGKYTLALPPGLYRIGVEPVRSDRTPLPWNQSNFETQFGEILKQNDFERKFYTGNGEDGSDPGQPAIVRVVAGQTVSGIDFITDRTVKIANFGLFDHRGFANAQPGTYYAVRVPRDQYQAAVAAADPGAVIQAAAFLTVPEDGTVVPRFSDAFIAAGKLRPDGSVSIDLGAPLVHKPDFVGLDTDFARLEPEDASRLTARVRTGMASGAIEDLFLVLRVPSGVAFPGIHHAPPQIGLDSGSPAYGLSYSSLDGKTWTPATGNFMFKLILGPDPQAR